MAGRRASLRGEPTDSSREHFGFSLLKFEKKGLKVKFCLLRILSMDVGGYHMQKKKFGELQIYIDLTNEYFAIWLHYASKETFELPSYVSKNTHHN